MGRAASPILVTSLLQICLNYVGISTSRVGLLGLQLSMHTEHSLTVPTPDHKPQTITMSMSRQSMLA